MKKETIAIQRPQGADLQPLIFRIPEVVLELFRCYLQAACRVGVWGGEVRLGLVKTSTQSYLAED